MTVGERLRAWREAEGLSQVVAAEMADVRQATWSDWENDRKKPQIEQAVAIQRITKGVIGVELWGESEEEHRARIDRVTAARATRTGTEG